MARGVLYDLIGDQMRLRRLIPRRHKLLGIPAWVWVIALAIVIIIVLWNEMLLHTHSGGISSLAYVVLTDDGAQVYLPNEWDGSTQQDHLLFGRQWRHRGIPFPLWTEVDVMVYYRWSRVAVSQAEVLEIVPEVESRTGVEIGAPLPVRANANPVMRFALEPEVVNFRGIIALVGTSALTVWLLWALTWWVVLIRTRTKQNQRIGALRRGVCPSCKYDIRDLPEPRCPECGEGLESESEAR